MDASDEGVDSVSPSPSPSQSGRIGAGGRTRSTRRKYVAESESLTAISQDAEDRLAAKRKDRQERRELRLKELQRKQQIEDAKENLVNGDSVDSKDIPSVRLNDRVTASVAASANATPSLSTPSSPRSASPLVNGESVGRGAGSNGASVRDPASAPHLLEPRANSLPRGAKGLNSRRGSGGGDGGSSADEDSRSVSLAQYRDVKKALADCEEKVKSLLMRNQHLDNEKTSLNYAVDLLQDQFEELSEQTVETDRMLKLKSHQLEAARRDNKHLQSNVAVLRQQLQQREDLVQQHGLVLVGGEVIEEKVGAKVGGGVGGGTDDADNEVVVKRRLAPAAIIQRHTAALLDKDSGSEGTLDFRLRRFAAEKEEMRETIRVLQTELEASTNADPANVSSGLNRSSVVTAMDELQTMTREERKKLDECKLKLEKTEMELMTADSAILRLEQQVKRYKEMLDTSEKTEEDLKTERRKMTRELRDAKGQVEELTNANKHLQTRLDKIRAVRGVLQSELNKPV